MTVTSTPSEFASVDILFPDAINVPSSEVLDVILALFPKTSIIPEWLVPSNEGPKTT